MKVEALKRTYRKKASLSGGNRVYRKWELWDIGDLVIGKYIGIHTDQFEHACPIIAVEEAMFKNGKGPEYVGKELVLNYCGHLGKAMEKMSEEQIFQVEYNGKHRLEAGSFKGKDSHKVSVDALEVEPENSGVNSDDDFATDSDDDEDLLA